MQTNSLRFYYKLCVLVQGVKHETCIFLSTRCQFVVPGQSSAVVMSNRLMWVIFSHYDSADNGPLPVTPAVWTSPKPHWPLLVEAGMTHSVYIGWVSIIQSIPVVNQYISHKFRQWYPGSLHINYSISGDWSSFHKHACTLALTDG